MSDDIRDAFARQADALLSRRTTVQGIGLGALAAAAASLSETLAKKNNKRKKRRRRRNNGPPSCAERCPESFEECVERAADSLLCAVGVEAAEDDLERCVPCSSDQDCLAIDPFDNPFPYCVPINGVIDRETGEIDLTLAVACGTNVDAVCATLGSGR